MTAAEWMEFFLHDDHEQDKGTPGPYEQGATLRVASDHEFSEYWD